MPHSFAVPPAEAEAMDLECDEVFEPEIDVTSLTDEIKKLKLEVERLKSKLVVQKQVQKPKHGVRLLLTPFRFKFNIQYSYEIPIYTYNHD